jgi:hypothetical protein
VSAVLLGAAAVAGAAWAVGQASVVDDAFISFRYAHNLLDGHGLVYNPGERVEGFTNLLWTLAVAGGSALTGVELPLVALVLGGLVYVGNVATCARLGRVVAGGPAHLPLAAALLAVQYTFTSFATTGLETGAAALAVQLALLGLLTGRPGAAGLGFALATLLRPDQLLFYVAGAGVLLWRRADRSALAAYAAPLLLLAGTEIWRLVYYGDWLPNTFYAKDGGGAYWSQGWVYAAEFHLGSHFWVVLGLALLAGALPARSPAEVELRRFVVLAVPLFELYVLRLGGDFMAGRFYVSLLPLGLLAAEGTIHALAEARRSVWLAGAALGATLRGGSLVEPNTIRWFMADEGTVYPVVGWSPVEIGHSYWRVGRFLRERVTDQGLHPVLATGNIGFVGYYSGLPLIDLHGLTDRTIARRSMGERGHPGHEKWGSEDYLRQREVALVLSPSACARLGHPELTELRIADWPTSRPLCLRAYRPRLVDGLRRSGFQVPRIEVWLDRRIATLDQAETAQVADDLAFLDATYFPYRNDPRRASLVSWLQSRPAEPSR